MQREGQKAVTSGGKQQRESGHTGKGCFGLPKK